MSDDWADREHPTAEKLSAYQANELSPEEDDAIQEHVASCSFCIERLLELQRFLEFVPHPSREGVADLETAAEWRRLRERIETEQAGSPTRARKSRLRRVLGSPKTAYGLAAMLALGLVGLSTYTVRLRQELREPAINSRLVFLSSTASVRGAENEVEPIDLAPQKDTKITFSLEAPETPSFPGYRLEVRDSSGGLVAAGDDLRVQDGSFQFTLSTDVLPNGSYSIAVWGIKEGQTPVMAEKYEFRISRSKAP